jgi:hypothetical protein
VKNYNPAKYFCRISVKVMLRNVLLLFVSVLLFSCGQQHKPIVEPGSIDSLLLKANDTTLDHSIQSELNFWGQRINQDPGGFVNEEKYAYALESRFHHSGDISSLLSADSLLSLLKEKTKSGEANILRSLARIAISRHQFPRADSLIQTALILGSEKYHSKLMQFDVLFELGQHKWAEEILQSIYSTNEYGYFFRKARWFHYKGDLDSSIYAMQQAVSLGEGNKGLQSAALSNLGDLYLHNDDAANAYKNYIACLQNNPGDMHSLLGIASIALLHDGADTLADKIIRFCESKTSAPDPLWRKIAIAEFRSDSATATRYANEFFAKASLPAYGNMYNKYLLDICTSHINNGGFAKTISLKEIQLRPGPQSYSWHAWALYKAGEKETALAIFEKHVSGKPLEALELYYMGIMLQETEKKNLGAKYLQAAQKNKYDLSPAKIEKIRQVLGD